MAGRTQETFTKRAREIALKERRERKQAKKAEISAQRAARRDNPADIAGTTMDAPSAVHETQASFADEEVQ